MRRRRGWLIGLGLVGAGVGFIAYWLVAFFLPAGPDSETATVEIPLGSSGRKIGQLLRRAGVVRNATAFRWMVKALGEGDSLKAGEYQISRGASLHRIIDKLASGDAEAKWVVIPEGWETRQIAAAIQKQKLGSERRFRRLARRSPSGLGVETGSRRRSLDGYLFPDTYKVPISAKEDDIIAMMVENFQQKVVAPNQEAIRERGLTLDQVVIIASLIEREYKVDQDLPLISAVIRNRLQKKMHLQIDATLLYSLGRHKEELSNADKLVDSPYNTYQHRGLPPGPICNPGLKSILAALSPADVDYVYYVAKPDGEHIFTRTLAEHNAAILKIKAQKAAREPR